MSGDPKTLGAAIQKTGEVMTQVGAELQTGSTDVKALAEQLTAAANELTAALPKTADAPPENSLPQVPEEEVKEGQEGMGEDGELKQLTGEGPTHFAWRQADREGVEAGDRSEGLRDDVGDVATEGVERQLEFDRKLGDRTQV